MKLPVETWYPAIFRRRSRRSFADREVEQEKIARLEFVCKEFRPFPEARAEFVRSRPENVFKGAIGHYGRVKGAPHYISFIGDTRSAQMREAVGYTGEGIVLEATALGLDTCWVGGFFRPETIRQFLRLEVYEEVLSVTPVGYAVERKDFSEKLLSGFARSRQRKSLQEIASGPVSDPWIIKALEAARLAPSAVNRQPWQFRMEDRAMIISVWGSKKLSPVSRRLDCGIAMLHFELGARAAGIEGRWEFLVAPDVARFMF
ncbi:MAG: nitroreductase family protein [Acidobacteriota bacterium]